ncbi:MAG: hypothetical protein ABIK36_15945 [Pseudomonadota bacterium]
MKLANLATAAVFAAFLAAPIGSLASFGPDQFAEKLVTAKQLFAPQLLAADDDYRNDVARRLVSNSPIGMDAISAKNTLDFKVFGFTNTPEVISGEAGWLFYKPGFENGKCLSDREIGFVLGRVEALRVIARAIGIDYRVSVSPDKEVVYPEKLGPAAEAAAGCKILSSRKWRKVAEASGSSVIDHFKVMGHDVTDDLLYFKTDTHWNELGKIRAFRQLVGELTGREIPGEIISNATSKYETDSTRNLLRVHFEEEKKLYNDYIDKNLPAESLNRIPKAVIIHDSFYGVSRDLISRIFLNPTLLTYGAPDLDRKIRDILATKPQLVLANTVERYLKQRVWGDLAWTGAVGKAFIDSNAEAARGCPVHDIGKDRLTLKSLDETPSGDFAAGVDPQIHVRLPDDGRPCIRVLFGTALKQPTFVHLPIRDAVNQNGPYFEGFSLTLADSPGQRDIWVILPEEFAGTTLRIDPIASNGLLSKLKVQTGSLPPISVTRQ